MTLRAQAEQALNSIAAFADGREQITCLEAGQQLRCDLSGLDRMACAIELFEVQSAAIAGASIDRLKSIAETLSKRLTYLLEPISPIETDAHQCIVQLRSNPPQQNESGRSYYELLVATGGHLRLCRFTKEPGNPRRAIPAQFTREVLLRLVSDFASCSA